MNTLVVVARMLLGLAFLVFGLDFFIGFLPPFGGDPSPAGSAFLEALFATGYLFQVIKAIEIGSGILLLLGVCVPLALALLAPVLFNIVLYHLLLDPNGLVLALALAALELFLLWSYRDAFRGLLAARPQAAPLHVPRRWAYGRSQLPEERA